ncbi:N-acetylglucosamine kinase [Paraclostridium bifermentans]|uniref:N-acetylglucosamine kinase n=1 Tax=Paraclostridium bifermentans TaxID=1490 RepID=UPI0034DFBD47
MYYIGVDGGGTKTTFTMINNMGEKITQYTTKTTHYEQVGFDGLEDTLNEGLSKIIEKSNVDIDKIDSVFLGIPGYGEVKSVVKKINCICERVFNKIEFRIGNDVEAGFEGSLAGKPGINIVSGTGSIALGKDLHGNTIRCGGWGDYVGDEGSAHWIGKKTIEVFSKEADKRLNRGLIYEKVREYLDIDDDFEIIDYVSNKINKDRTQIAQFSKICFESAKLNDENALDIFNLAGYELSLLVKMIINELEFEDEITISYSGGVFKSGDLIINPIKNNLSGYNVKLIKPILEPDMGSCLLAYKIKNNHVSNEVLNNMINKTEYSFS